MIFGNFYFLFFFCFTPVYRNKKGTPVSTENCLSRYSSLSPFELQLVSRLSLASKDHNTLLLQHCCPKVASRFLRAAWFAGFRCAIIPTDIPRQPERIIKAQLGSFLHLQSGNGITITDSANDSTLSLDNWLTDAPGIRESQPYIWSKNECALVLFTSDITGTPLGVCHSLDNIYRAALRLVEHFSLQRSETLICLEQFHTVNGMLCGILPFFSHQKVHFPETDSFLQLMIDIARTGPSNILCKPLFIQQLATYGERVKEYLTDLKEIFCTGADLDENYRQRVEAIFNLPVYTCYSLPETTGVVLAEKKGVPRRQTLPPPCPEVQLELSPSIMQPGFHNLIIKAPTLFLGYLGESSNPRDFFETADLINKKHHKLFLHKRAINSIQTPSAAWLYPALLEEFLHTNYNHFEYSVSPVKVRGGYQLKVTVTSDSALATEEINHQICRELGHDYLPHSWEFLDAAQPAIQQFAPSDQRASHDCLPITEFPPQQLP